MKRYGVLCDYGSEGWQFVGDCDGYDSILDAVLARGKNQSGSFTMVIEIVPVLEAYRRADYEQRKD